MHLFLYLHVRLSGTMNGGAGNGQVEVEREGGSILSFDQTLAVDERSGSGVMVLA